MRYAFPLITNINQVLEAIQDKPEFIVAERGDHRIINYTVAFENTFPPVVTRNDAILRECRGIAFDKNDKIIRRPFHKFMNLGEREETGYDQIDLDKPHHILSKMDGSMIVPFDTRERVIWGTKMGDTDVAVPVQQFIERNPRYSELFKSLNLLGYSPIFEWCSRSQRIVLDYPEDQLVLLAIRHIENGKYLPYDTIKGFADCYRIPVVQAHDTDESEIQSFSDHVRNLKGIEGFVIRFADGHMIKIKTDEYVRLHKGKELISNEKNLALLILNNEIDDLKSFMSEDDIKRIVEFEIDLRDNIKRAVTKIQWNCSLARAIGRKEFALEHAPQLDVFTRAGTFKLMDGYYAEDTVMEYVIETIKKNCNNNSNYAKLETSWFAKGN